MSHRTFHDVVIIFKPCEKAGENASDIVNTHLANSTLNIGVGLIIARQIIHTLHINLVTRL